jgi:hypothetical protein
VSFFTRDVAPRVAYRVHVPFKAGAATTVDVVTPPEIPGPELAAFYLARQAAIGGLSARKQLIDAVVLPAQPAIGEDGILVYLLAGTMKPDVAVLGQHHRVLVSPDGKRVVRFEPLSKGIIQLPMTGGNPSPGAHVVSLAVTHVVSDTPLETHVFASLRYGIALVVATRAATWRVDRDKIDYLGPSATASAARP